MSNTNKLIVVFVVIFLFWGLRTSSSEAGASPAVALVGSGADRPVNQDRPNARPVPPGHDPEAKEETLTTPELIERAFSQGEISAEERLLYQAYAIYEYSSLPARYRSQAPWWGTSLVIEVNQQAAKIETDPQLSVSNQVRAELDRLLAPEDATVCDQEDGPNNTNSANFHVNYGVIGGGLTITDYTTALETSFSTEVTSYGWAMPPLCTGGTCADNPWDRYPVQIAGLGGGLLGYVLYPGGSYTGLIGDNPNTVATETDAHATCMVLNDDYGVFPAGALNVTAAHEFSHAIQFGTGDPGAEEDPMWYESTSNYIEDDIFDAVNINYYDLYPVFTSCLGEYSGNEYGNWLFFRYAAEHTGGTNVAGGGEDVVQNYWGNVSLGQEGLGAYDNALSSKGANLDDIYHQYAIASRFMKSCPAASPYCYEEADGYVADQGSEPASQGSIPTLSGSYYGSLQNHYALNWVDLPATGVYSVTLQNYSSSGLLRGSIVADMGSDLQVTPLPALVGGMDYSILTNYTPPVGATRVIAVITNQQKQFDNPSYCASSSYGVHVNQTDVPPGGTAVRLPLILKSPVSGRVTDHGAPAPMEQVELRYYDGYSWWTYATETTDENGYYMFNNVPTLDVDQEYYVRWENLANDPNRLWAWYCNSVTSTSPPSTNTCNFDLKGIPLGLPNDGATVNLPSTFTWTARGFSDDSYEFILYDNYGDATYWTYPPLGNVSSYTLNFRPAGFVPGVAYNWYMSVYTPYGWGDGWSEAYSTKDVIFSGASPGPRVTGRVTSYGGSASGVRVYLRYWDGYDWWTHAVATTNSTGYYTFNSFPQLDYGQVAYVRWDNSADNASLLYRWWCYQISIDSYSREYTCNFDLKNIPLVSPADYATVSLPTTFRWTSRGFSGESYELDLYDPTYGDPYFYTPLLGNVNSYQLTSLPEGFLPGWLYVWDVTTYTDYDGYGLSYDDWHVTFTGSSLKPILSSAHHPRGTIMEDPLPLIGR